MGSPDLSVVVVSLVGGDALAGCIDRLPITEIECLVVLKAGASDPRLWQRRYPRVRFLPASDDPAPVRRRRGVEAASGAIVGLIEDTCWPDRGWCTAVRSAFARPEVVAAGGSVAIADFLSSQCKAFAWSEFGAFAPAVEATAGAAVPAVGVASINNAFRRAPLLAALAGEAGLVPEAVCDRLRASNGVIVRSNAMAVTYSACDPEGATLAARFDRGRLQGVKRASGGGWVPRTLEVIRAAILPVGLTVRDFRRIGRGVRGDTLLPLLFWLVLMESAWAIGVAVGAVTGRPTPEPTRG